MRRIALRLWVVCWLVLVWILLWGTFSAANILSGLLVALVIILLLPLPVVPVEGRVHPLSLMRLIVTVGYYLVLSSVQVAFLAVQARTSAADRRCCVPTWRSSPTWCSRWPSTSST